MYQVTFIQGRRIVSLQSPSKRDMFATFAALAQAGKNPRIWDRTTKVPRLLA